MLHRLAPMTVKVAMLLAAGCPTTLGRDGLHVSRTDADECAITSPRSRNSSRSSVMPTERPAPCGAMTGVAGQPSTVLMAVSTAVGPRR